MENYVNELVPAASNRKSYGKRAYTVEYKGRMYLVSYNTVMASCRAFKNGNFGLVAFHSDFYSRTTMNHVNDFLSLVKKNGMNKKAFMDQKIKALPVSYYDIFGPVRNARGYSGQSMVNDAINRVW